MDESKRANDIEIAKLRFACLELLAKDMGLVGLSVEKAVHATDVVARYIINGELPPPPEKEDGGERSIAQG